MKIWIPLIAFALLSGCASLERTFYETGESYRQDQCRQNLGENCDQRTRYDDYQKQREAR